MLKYSSIENISYGLRMSKIKKRKEKKIESDSLINTTDNTTDKDR